MKERYEHFFSPEEDVLISFATNFELDPRKDYEDVIVFNNGLVCSSQHYKYQLQYFDELGYKILIHDYRGHFQSTLKKDIETVTFHNIARDLEKLFKHCNIHSTHLVGHSMGVPVSAFIYLDNPKVVKSMIFIAGTLFPMKGVGMTNSVLKILELSQKKSIIPFGKLSKFFWETGDKNPLFRKIVRQTGFNRKQVSEDYVKFYLSKVAELGFDLFAQLFLELNRQSFLSELNEIHVPTLVIAGEKDFVVPHYLQKETAKQLDHGHYYFVKSGSHVPQIEFPELINERINFFLQELR